jgi:hypothetical protein
VKTPSEKKELEHLHTCNFCTCARGLHSCKKPAPSKIFFFFELEHLHPVQFLHVCKGFCTSAKTIFFGLVKKGNLNICTRCNFLHVCKGFALVQNTSDVGSLIFLWAREKRKHLNND